MEGNCRPGRLLKENESLTCKAFVRRLMVDARVAARLRNCLHKKVLRYGSWYAGLHGEGPSLRILSAAFAEWGIDVTFVCEYVVEKKPVCQDLYLGMRPEDAPKYIFTDAADMLHPNGPMPKGSDCRVQVPETDMIFAGFFCGNFSKLYGGHARSGDNISNQCGMSVAKFQQAENHKSHIER